MSWPIKTEDLARQIITGRTEDIDLMSIGEFIEGMITPGSLTGDEFDSYRAEVDQLVNDAAVMVVLPGDPVCPECGGTGQPSESDGTPKDLPQYEAVLDAIDTWLDNEDDSDGLATTIMGLLGAAKAEREAAK